MQSQLPHLGTVQTMNTALQPRMSEDSINLVSLNARNRIGGQSEEAIDLSAPNKLEDSFNIQKFAKIDHFQTIHQEIQNPAQPSQNAQKIEPKAAKVQQETQEEAEEANIPNLQQKISQGIKEVITRDRAQRDKASVEDLKRQLKEKEEQEREDKEKLEEQQNQFSTQLKQIRETLQEEYN